jgi:hypothetical protein
VAYEKLLKIIKTDFLDKRYTTDNYIPDTVRAMDTYWFHAHIEFIIMPL